MSPALPAATLVSVVVAGDRPRIYEEQLIMMNVFGTATMKMLGRTTGRGVWVRRLGLGLAIVMVVVMSTALVGVVAKARLQTAHPPVGQLVDVGGYRLHLACEGAGSPTVILEAGAGNVGLHWALVQPQVATQTRVCVYDRGGMGWSDPSPRPRTPAVRLPPCLR
jgi:hypothetical protein